MKDSVYIDEERYDRENQGRVDVQEIEQYFKKEEAKLMAKAIPNNRYAVEGIEEALHYSNVLVGFVGEMAQILSAGGSDQDKMDCLNTFNEVLKLAVEGAAQDLANDGVVTLQDNMSFVDYRNLVSRA